MSDPLLLAVPSKGRIMDDTLALFARAGIALRKTVNERGYRGKMEGDDNVEVSYLSASEIALKIKQGRIHLGVTGEDLVREIIVDAADACTLMRPLGFGHADMVVAVPDCWVDVSRMSDIEDVAAAFHREHGRRLRVATKFPSLTRRIFAEKEVAGYRIVESAGATEGAPSSRAAELIVDITSTGATLKANHLRILEDGVILRSQVNLVCARRAAWTPALEAARDSILARIDAALA